MDSDEYHSSLDGGSQESRDDARKLLPKVYVSTNDVPVSDQRNCNRQKLTIRLRRERRRLLVSPDWTTCQPIHPLLMTGLGRGTEPEFCGRTANASPLKFL